MKRSVTNLRQEFKRLTDALLGDINNAYGTRVKMSDIELKKDEDSYQLEVVFNDVNERISSRKRNNKLTVLLIGHLTFKNDDSKQLEGYGTKLSYCKCKDLDKGQYNYVSGFHFDYRRNCDQDIDHAHPLFHAQLEWDAAKDLLEKQKWTSENNKVNELKNIRIPTAQMDFFSCILMLVADHLIDPKCPKSVGWFENYIKQVCSIIPQADLSVHGSCREYLNNNLPSAAWYCSRI